MGLTTGQKTIAVGCGWWGFRERAFVTHLDSCAANGFRTLEIGIGDEFAATFPMNTDQQQAAEAIAAATAADIKLSFATAENDFSLADPQAHRRMVAHVLAVIDIARLFGVSHLRLFAGFTPAKEVTARLYEQVIDAFQIVNERCMEHGIAISIETHGKITWKGGVALHENTISTDPHYLERLVRDLPANIGFNYDPGNIKAVWPGEPDCWVSIINERINYCHLKDWVACDGGWVAGAIGDGTLDYGTLLPKIAFDGTYLIEYEPLSDLEDGIRRSLTHLEQLGYRINLK